jgi:ATP-binding cassette subfamily B protein
MKKVFKFLLPYWWMILLIIGTTSIGVWSSLQLPTLMAHIVNDGIVGGNQDYIVKKGIEMLVVTAVGGVAVTVTGFFAARVAAGFSRSLYAAVFAKVLSFSQAEINGFSTASLLTRSTNDIQGLQRMMVMILRLVLQAPIMAVGAVLNAMSTAPNMAWIMALSVTAFLILVVGLFALVMPKFKIVQKLIDRLNLVARENLTGLRIIRAFRNEKYEEEKFEQANNDLVRLNLWINRAISLMQPIMTLIVNGTLLAIVWVGAHFIATDDLQIGNMMAFMQYAMQVMMSFMFLTMAFIMVPRAVVSWRRITEVVDTPLSIKPAKKPKTAKNSLRGTVEFKNVSFAYEDADEPILKNISFVAKAGQTTAFIGSTGSGTSTLVNLIPRFYDVTHGKVLVDGVNVRDYEQEDLMRKIGYVPQKGVLFSGTIESNIAFGANDVDQQRVHRAAKIAQAYGFIEKLDDKFEAHIAQGGSNVSGGQKQRLSIARAVAKDPEVYIFDDSFSALDFKTDLALREALKSVARRSAMLIVAQRVGTIKHAEQIVVLDKGKIAGMGTHGELLKSCKVYREIAASQLSEAELNAELEAANG